MASETPERGGGRGDAALVHDRARVVRRYLSALDMRRPGRTAARTAETISHRMHQVDTLLVSADPVQRLHLTQERIDLHAELLRVSAGTPVEFAELEAAFVRVVRGYSERHGVTFSAWRQIGVDVAVLERGGLTASKSRGAPRPAPTPAPSADAAVAPAATPSADAAVAPGPSCVDELPPLPAAEEVAPPAKRSAAARSKTAAKTPEGDGAPKKSAPRAKRAPAKKAPASVQQQLPADTSS